MNGIYHIEAHSANLRYDVTIKSKYTIIIGDSATGKTEFYKMIKNQDICKVSCEVPVIAVEGRDTLVLCKEERILVIDQDSAVFPDILGDLLLEVQKSECYFILITRMNLKRLHNNDTDICTFESESFISDSDFFGIDISDEDVSDKVLTINRLKEIGINEVIRVVNGVYRC